MSLIQRSRCESVTSNQLLDKSWYAVYTAPCREKRVLEHLVSREIESFLPTYRTSHKWKNGCRVELDRPLFPGYVFVRVPIGERGRVLSVPSVIAVVSRGRVPEPLQEDIIPALRANNPLRNAEPHAHLTSGEQVVIIAGPFAGLSGIVLRQKSGWRVVITLDLISQSMAVEVGRNDVEPIGGEEGRARLWQ